MTKSSSVLKIKLFVLVSFIFFLADRSSCGSTRRSKVDWKKRTKLMQEEAYLGFAKGVMDFLSLKCEIINSLRRDELESNEIDPRSLNVLLYSPKSDRFESFPMSAAVGAVLEHESFDVSRKTMIYVHGFNGLAASEDLLDMGRALTSPHYRSLDEEDGHDGGGYNFLTLDGQTGLHSRELDYARACGLAPRIGARLGEFAARLLLQRQPPQNDTSQNQNKIFLRPPHLHLVGHSIGAHVCAHAAREYTRINENINMMRLGGNGLVGSGKPARITGLDPAAPCFDGGGGVAAAPLSRRDADYVDVIRTSVLSHREGLVGHADYVVNGRDGAQPGCSPLDVHCSHDRANTLFAESTSSLRGFPATRCRRLAKYDCRREDGVSFAGLASSPRSRGFYLLRTRTERPYATWRL